MCLAAAQTMAGDKGRRPAESNKGRRPVQDDLLDWFTVSYKAIYTAIVIVLVAAGAAIYFFLLHPSERPKPKESPAVSTAITARFNVIEGTVKVKPVGVVEWVTADKSMVLQKSDLVRTGSGSGAEIAFSDGTVVQLRADSLVTIEGGEDWVTSKASVHVSSGIANFQTPVKGDRGTSITTPTTATRVGPDANGVLNVNNDGQTDVNLYKGKAEVETKAGQKQALGPNEGLRVDAGGKAGQKVILPPSPQLLAPPHQTEVTYMDPTRAATILVWKNVPVASSYYLQLDYSPYFNRPIVDRKGIKESSVELRGLDLGKYYWRVAAVDKEDVQGNFSDFFRFTVSRPTSANSGSGPPPPLILDPLDVRTNIVQVKGRTEPGATVTVNGTRVDVAEDGSFNEYITLQQPGRQLIVIRSTGINGGINEQKRPVVVAY